MRRSIVVVVVLAVASVANAGVVAPSKPSQTVLLKPGAACGAGFALDTRINPDGTTAPFSIPDKQVLVLDSLTWVVLGSAVAGSLCGVTLRVDSQTIWSDTITQSNSFASCGQSAPLPSLVIGAGKTLCITVGTGGDVNAGVTRVHGFVTKSK